jgi:hypothetical protein
MFFFSQWQSKARAVAEHLNASIKLVPRRPLLLVKGQIPDLFDVDAKKREVKGVVD